MSIIANNAQRCLCGPSLKDVPSCSAIHMLNFTDQLFSVWIKFEIKKAPHNLCGKFTLDMGIPSQKDQKSCMWSNDMKCFVTVRARSGKFTIHRNQHESKSDPETPPHPLASLFDTEICWGSPCWVWSLFTHYLWMGDTRLIGMLHRQYNPQWEHVTATIQLHILVKDDANED